MEDPLSFTWTESIDNKGKKLRSKIFAVSAEAELGEDSERGCPKKFTGKLVGVTIEQLLHLASADDVEVGFRYRRYKLAELDRDGVFMLHRID